MGQTCVCTNRFYVHEKIHDVFVEKLLAATRALNVGNGAADGITQGPLIDMAAVEKVEAFISDATSKGGRVSLGGKRHALGETFFEPTVITDANSDMDFATNEIFGPIAAVFKFEDEEEVVSAANATEFGLAAYVYTRDVGRIFRLNDSLEYGLIGFNSGLITAVEVPFGGLKESGLGSEGGSQGLQDYLETKYVCIAGM
jgi:succinate-semialdehyde dehydrogenase/glutarate-semialdehyde dehydrogenase